jgi:hypothetical protein
MVWDVTQNWFWVFPHFSGILDDINIFIFGSRQPYNLQIGCFQFHGFSFPYTPTHDNLKPDLALSYFTTSSFIRAMFNDAFLSI